MFLKIIAIFFLVLFLIKILSPNVFPLIGKFFKNLLSYSKELWIILFNGFFRSVNLLIKKTVLVVGLVIIATLVIATVYTTYIFPNIMDLKNWFNQFKDVILDIYVYTFFLGTYLMGIIDYLKDRTTLTNKFINYIDSKLKSKNQKQYVYDDEQKKYIYK